MSIRNVVLGLIIIRCLFFNHLGFAQNITKDQVVTAVEAIRQGDYKQFNIIIQTNPESAIPYLHPYIHDDNKSIRFEIIDCASDAKTIEGLNLVIEMVRDPDDYVADHAVMMIFDHYSPEMVRLGNQVALANNLESYLQHWPASGKAILLLSACPAINAIKIIKYHRSQYANERIGVFRSVDPVTFSVSCDIALAELGEKDALQRYFTVINEGQTNNLLYILYNLRWITRYDMLLPLIELLNDKRNAFQIYRPAKNPPFYKTCDIALEQFSDKAKIHQEHAPLSIINYPEAELQRTYRELFSSFTADQQLTNDYIFDGNNIKATFVNDQNSIKLTIVSNANNWFNGFFPKLKVDADTSFELNLPEYDEQGLKSSVAKWSGMKPVFTYGNSYDFHCFEWFVKDETGRWQSGDLLKNGKEKSAGDGKVPEQQVIPPELAEKFLSADGQYWCPWKEVDATETKIAENSFIIKQRFEQPSATVTMRVPFTYTYLQSILMKVNDAKFPGVFIDELGNTPEKRKLQVIRIENPKASVTTRYRRTVLVIAREHATEPASSWALYGLLARLLESSPTSPLRKDITWLLIPIFDPDGSANSQMDRLAEKFCNPYKDSTPPEVFSYAQYFADYVNKGNTIDLAVTLHNVEANECPNIFNPYFDNRYEKDIIAINQQLYDVLSKQGYTVPAPDETWGKGGMPIRLYGWCELHFGSFPLAYEVNDRFPANPLNLQRLQGIGGTMAEIFANWCYSDTGKQWHQRALTMLEERAKKREAYFKEPGNSADRRTKFDLLMMAY